MAAHESGAVAFRGCEVNRSDAPAVLNVQDLRVGFHTRGGVVRALNEVCLQVAPGAIQVVIGESGGGKSVLAHALMGLLPSNAHVRGSAEINGKQIIGATPKRLRELRTHTMALAPQSPGAALNPVRRIGHLFDEVAEVKGIAKSDRGERVRSAVEAMGLSYESIARKYPFQLSGGMQQRVTNALALVGRPDLVLADEPTSSLDRDRVGDVTEQLLRVAGTGAAVVVITHDLELARRLGGRTAVLYAGYLVEERPTPALFADPAHPYTRALLAAQPENGLHPIPGSPAEMTRRFTACPFEPRCPLAVDQCRRAIPGRSRAGDGEVRCFVTGA